MGFCWIYFSGWMWFSSFWKFCTQTKISGGGFGCQLGRIQVWVRVGMDFIVREIHSNVPWELELLKRPG